MSPFMNKVVRSAYNAIGTGGLTFLVTWQVPGITLHRATLAGLIAGLVSLGFRGGEAAVDASKTAP